MPEPAAWWQPLLCCPDCGAELNDAQPPLSCAGSCGWQSRDPRDLRGVHPRALSLTHDRQTGRDPEAWLQEINTEAPARFYRGPTAQRDSTEFLSVLQGMLQPGDAVLDLGCGLRDQAAPLQSLGYRYLGGDVNSPAADLLVDTHTLPFADASFEAVFSYAVLEHLRDPLVGIAEVTRVLKPGGLYLGSVSLGEPFHASYFHHTAWGLLALLQQRPELKPLRLWSTRDTLDALAGMGRYPRLIRHGLGMVATLQERLPLLAPRRMRWSAKRKQIDALHRAGSIGFVIQKQRPEVGL